MLKGDHRHWGRAARLLHWGIALLVAVVVPIGFLMNATYAPAQRDAALLPRLYLLSALHHSIGFAILILVVARLAWRRHDTAPDAPAQHGALTMLARATHGASHLLLIALPLSGWAALSAFGRFPTFFGPIHLFAIRSVAAADDPYGYAFFAAAHRWCWTIGGGLLALHVAGALWHHLIRRDDVLVRMWRPRSTPR